MGDSYQLIDTYGADADTASQWLGVQPGYSAVTVSLPGIADYTYDVVNFAGVTEAAGGGIQVLNTSSGFGSDLTDMTTLLAGGYTTVNGAPEFNWNGASGPTGGDVNYYYGNISPITYLPEYTVSQPMSEWGAVQNYVLELDDSDLSVLGSKDLTNISVTGFANVNIKLGSTAPVDPAGGGPTAVVYADEISQGYFDMSQAPGPVVAMLATSTPRSGDEGTTIVYNSSPYGGGVNVISGDMTGTFFSNGSTFDNTGAKQTLVFNETGAGDTVDITSSSVRADINLTNGGTLVGLSAWSAMVSANLNPASLEAGIGATTHNGAVVELNAAGRAMVDVAAGSGLSVITDFSGATELGLIIASFVDEKSYTDADGITAYAYLNSNGGAVVLIGPAAQLSRESPSYSHYGDTTTATFAPG